MHRSEPEAGSLIASDRVFPDATTSAVLGAVRFNWFKAIWVLGHGMGGLIGIIWFATPEAFLVFVMLSAITICAGHSVGMHRLLIHRSFETYRWVEVGLVWLGTLVGMAGPFGMIKAHDMRDWHQRQVVCPRHPAHDAGFWLDAYWQLCCTFELARPPRLVIEPSTQNSRIYRGMERTWWAQQILLAIALYAFGGWGWVLFGCCLRVCVSLVGHWMVGHFAHKRGGQSWRIDGVAVQGFNLPGLGWITFGENWHGNHHAFPHSAKLGLEQGQFDPGFMFILGLQKIGLAWGVKLPMSEPARVGLARVIS